MEMTASRAVSRQMLHSKLVLSRSDSPLLSSAGGAVGAVPDPGVELVLLLAALIAIYSVNVMPNLVILMGFFQMLQIN